MRVIDIATQSVGLLQKLNQRTNKRLRDTYARYNIVNIMLVVCEWHNRLSYHRVEGGFNIDKKHKSRYVGVRKSMQSQPEHCAREVSASLLYASRLSDVECRIN